MMTKRKTITLKDELYNEINRFRGNMPFSTYVSSVLTSHITKLKGGKKK